MFIRAQQKGFTLLELMIVLTIMASMMMGIAFIIRAGYYRMKADQAERLTGYVQKAMSEYVAIEGRYPCPAVPRSAGGVTGQEACGGLHPDSIAAPYIKLKTASGEKVLYGTLPEYVLVRRGTGTEWKKFSDYIRINDFWINDFEDPWGNEIYFAVTENFVDGVAVNENGVIPVVDGANQATGGVSDDAHYAVIMQGVYNGGANDPTPWYDCLFDSSCDDGSGYAVPWPGVVLPGKKLAGLAGAKETNDDVVSYYLSNESRYWVQGAGALEGLKTNPNISGRVVIQKTPLSDSDIKLDVGGNLYVEDRVRVEALLCDQSETNCIAPDSLFYHDPNNKAVNALKCTPPQYLKGISVDVNKKLVPICQELTFPQADYTCATKKVSKIYTSGRVDCVE
jgi:prepilin-type N-terminal cleavage/methylation domain-containing protein